MDKEDFVREFRLLLLADAALFQATQYFRMLDASDRVEQVEIVRARLVERISALQPTVYQELARKTGGKERRRAS